MKGALRTPYSIYWSIKIFQVKGVPVVRDFIVCLALLLSNTAAAFTVLEAEKLDYEVYKVRDFRDSYYLLNEGESWKYGTAVVFDFNLIRADSWRLYLNNRVYGESTDVQYRRVGYTYEGGIQLGPKVDVYYGHNSEHLIERANPDAKFEFTNVYGIRVHFYSR